MTTTTTPYKAKAELVRDWAVLKVYDRKTKTSQTNHVYIELDDQDTLYWAGSNQTYNIGSVFTYAMRNGDCPLATYQQAKEFGHKIYWITQQATAVTGTRTAPREAVSVSIGQIVKFQGHFFLIVGAPNDNLDLKPFDVK